VAILALTYRCQCQCVHCSAGRYKLKGEELTLSEWKAVIDEIDILGVPRIHLTGGEPLLKKEFLDIAEYAAGKGIPTFLETNGYSLTEEIVKRLKNSKIASIDISIDSIDKKQHDELRGLPGSFEKAQEAMVLCRKYGMVHMVSTYATRENIYSGELNKIIEWAKENRADAVRIMPPQPSGKWFNRFDIVLKKEDKSYLRAHFPFYPILDRTEIPQCPIKDKYTFFVAPEGEIYPCPHLPFSFGNVKRECISEILAKMAAAEMFQRKSLCYINEPNFREKYIDPLIEKEKELPLKI